MSPAPALAPDAAVPQRDILLDPRALAPRVEAVLGADGRVPIDRCELVRVKYRVGSSLSAVLRVRAAGATHVVSARTMKPGRGVEERARLADAVPSGPLRPASYDPDLDTVFWAFPSDRRIGSLALLAGPSPALDSLTGGRCAPELVAYVS